MIIRRPPTSVGTWRDVLRSDGHRGILLSGTAFMVSKTTQVDLEKSELRRLAQSRRDQLSSETRMRDAAALPQHSAVITTLAGPQAVFSSYRAMGSECDTAPLEASLRERGHQIALPVIKKMAQPLLFRAWAPGDRLVARKWGIQEPDDQAAVLEPDVLLLPLLAFDRAGWRLGYGGGFYDRTLARLRAIKPIVTIGIAYDSQEVDAVPHSAYDERLDWIMTPTALRPSQLLEQ